MTGEAQLCLAMAVLLLTSSVWSLPRNQEGISSSEKVLIRRVSASVPGDRNLNGGGYYLQGVGSDWTIFKSVSDESQLTPQELVMIRRIADSVSGDTNGGGGGDWNIVKSIELQRSEFGDVNDLESIEYPFVGQDVIRLLGGGGGSIDAPYFNTVPKTCEEPNKLIRGQCRMTFF